MKHQKVSDPLNNWLVIAAALVVLFSTMLDAHVAFVLSIGVAIIVATIKIIQSCKVFDKRGKKLL